MIKKFYGKKLIRAICAVSFLLFAILVNGQINADSVEASTLLEEARALTQQKAFDTSNQKALAAAQLFKQQELWKQWASCQHRIFFNAYRNNTFPEAIPLLEAAILNSPIASKVAVAKTKNYLAFCYDKIADPLTASKLYEAIIPIYQANKDTLGLHKIYGNLAKEYLKLGDYPHAIQILETATITGQSLSDKKTLRNNRRNLGRAYFYNHQFEKAAENYLIAQKIINDKDGTIELELAKINLAKRQYQQALINTNIALDLASRAYGRGSSAVAYVYKAVGEIHLQQRRYERARSAYQKALVLFQQHKNIREIAKVYIGLGNSHYPQSPTSALENYQFAMTTLVPAFDASDPSDNPTPEQLSSEIWLITILEKKGLCFYQLYLQTAEVKWLRHAYENLQLAIQSVEIQKRVFVESESKFVLRSETQSLYENALKVALALDALEPSGIYRNAGFEITQKANAYVLREMINDNEAMRLSGIQETEMALLFDLQKKINLTDHQLSIAKKNEQINLQQTKVDLISQKNTLTEQLDEQYPAFQKLRTRLSVSSIANIQKSLQPNTLLIKYFLSDTTLYTFAISQNQASISTQTLPDNFDQLIQQYHRSISDLDFVQDSIKVAEQAYLKSAHSLYNILLKEAISTQPSAASFDRLTIIPDGMLYAIPFEPLLTSSASSWLANEQMLLSKYAISYAYFCNQVNMPAQRKTEGGSLSAFGLEFDDYTLQELKKLKKDTVSNKAIQQFLRDKNWSKLPFSDDEALSVAKIMNGRAWVNLSATKSTFLQQARDSRFLHIATHAILDQDNPNNSSIIFTKTDQAKDNILRLSEIYSMNLSAEQIVLSACNTNVGVIPKGEGAISLARAFHLSGVPSVVTSFWSVPDEASMKIMVSYYQLIAEGMPKDRALQQAKLKYLTDNQMSSPAFRAPVHWAAWAVSGNTRPVRTTVGTRFSVYHYLLFAMSLFIVFFLVRKWKNKT